MEFIIIVKFLIYKMVGRPGKREIIQNGTE